MADERSKLIKKPFGKKDSGPHNMKDYEAEKKAFTWDSVHKHFSWDATKKVNMAHECIDRHCEEGKGGKTALIYDADDRKERYTFDQLRGLSNKFANVLKKYGIKRGDRIFIFMPRAPELYVATMGALKAGCIIGPLFEAFMHDAVKDRMLDSQSVMIITTPELRERIPVNDLLDLKEVVYVLGGRKPADAGMAESRGPHGAVLKHAKLDADVRSGLNFISYEEEMKEASDKHETVFGNLETPMILHYTSGSTGKPKGVLHVYNAMIGHYQTGKSVLDLNEHDVYWCTADPGWVTGTSYGIFAPMLIGVTNVIKGGRFSADAWYKCIQDHKVTVWYSAPTAFRMLMSQGAGKEKQYDLSCLRHICSVGEPLNPEVVWWGLDAYGLPIHDTWWMTETGHMLICNYPSMPIKPGSMGKPIPGVEAEIVDEEGKVLPPLSMGNLVIKKGWPGMMRQIWGNKEKYDTYFQLEPWYMSGDSAYMDKEGYFFFEGRLDDVIKTSGERVGPFEVESALIEHPAVAEAGVIGKPDQLRGHIIKAFVVLRPGFAPSDKLKEEIMDYVKKNLAAHAKPKEIEFMEKLPKTRSGKIMRRVLKAKELGLPVGDLSTMED